MNIMRMEYTLSASNAAYQHWAQRQNKNTWIQRQRVDIQRQKAHTTPKRIRWNQIQRQKAHATPKRHRLLFGSGCVHPTPKRFPNHLPGVLISYWGFGMVLLGCTVLLQFDSRFAMVLLKTNYPQQTNYRKKLEYPKEPNYPKKPHILRKQTTLYCITALLYYCIIALLHYCIIVLLHYCITVSRSYCITVLLH